jgi:hypothetical protein
LDSDAATGRTPGPRYRRRILWLGAFVLLLLGGYSAGWFYFADLLRKQTLAAIAGMNGDGVSAECANLVVRGFPFRLGLRCDSVGLADGPRGIRMTAGSFYSAGQIHDLSRLVAELEGPATIDFAGAAPLALDWAGLRATARLAEPVPERLSVETTGLTAKLSTGVPFASVTSFEAHMRPNGDDLDLAARFEGLLVHPAAAEGRELPALSGHADISVTGGVSLAGSGVESLRGQAGTLRTLSLSTGPNTGLLASGPFSVGEDGLLDAELTLTVRDPEGLSAALAAAFPEAKSQIITSFSGLSALGPEPSLPLKIVKGKATLGFLPLGDLPPL